MGVRRSLFTGLFLLAILNPVSAQTPTPTQSADLYPSGWIDMMDLFVLSGSWKAVTGPQYGDLDGNGWCGPEDLLALLRDWNTTAGSIEMVTIPAGSFLMGNSGSARDTQYGFSDEYPRHTVNINYIFQMGKYEVTNAQYAEVLNWAKGRGYLRNSSGGSYSGGDVYHNNQRLLEVSSSYCDISYSGGQFVPKSRNSESMNNHPVKEVSWYGAVAFCNWASERDGLSECYNLSSWSLSNRNSGGYRLPSEAEWEYACRGSSSNPNRYAPFSFGDDLSVADLYSCQYSSLFNQYMVWCGNDDGWTEPVGSKLANDYGLHDMHGNLWEWCQDWWHETYSGAPTNGTPWDTQVASYSYRMRRGGSWDGFARDCRSANRSRFNPAIALNGLGFRVSRTP